MSLLLGVSAPAAVAGTLSYPDPNTLQFTAGDNLNHDVQFRLSADQAHDEIIDIQQFTTIPGDCTVVVANTWISCPGHPNMQADFGAGNDSVTTDGSLFDCFDNYTINLGDGTNDSRLSDNCATGETATITSGSGQDDLAGGAPNTTFFAGGGDDTVNGLAGDDVLHGGDGADTVAGGDGNDQMYGEGGNDTIRGGAGNDVEDGGPGDDRIGYSPGVSDDADGGADVIRGGDGTDKLLLDGHQGGMTISIDGQANDGTPGEGDNIGSDLEDISGTTGNDVFVGSPGPDKFSGDSGDDEIHGAGGNDDLYGGSGDDRIFGDAGNDKLQGANGADIVDGGAGIDQIYGDIGSCSFSCSFDADTLFAADGERDAVDCGGGADTAHVDQLDVVAFCASVDRQTVAVPGGPAGPAADPFGLKVAGSARSKALLKRGLTVRLKCPAACKITAELRYKSKKLGSARKTLTKAGAARLVVKISKKAKRTIRRLKKGNLSLRVKVTVAGKTTTLRKTIKFKH